MRLLEHTVQPPVSAYRAQPMTANEIDAHPDGDRIWATIMEMRLHVHLEHDNDYPSGLFA